MGDMNAKIGHGREQNIVGELGLGVRTERKERFLQSAQKTPLHLATPSDSLDNMVLIQILQLNRDSGICKTYPGADVYTSNILLLARIRVRLKRDVDWIVAQKLILQNFRIPISNKKSLLYWKMKRRN